MATFAVLLAVVPTWGLVFRRLARYSIALPIVLVVMGAVLSATQVVVIELNSEAVRTLVEMALAILLLANATRISARWLQGFEQLPLRMLAVGSRRCPERVERGDHAVLWNPAGESRRSSPLACSTPRRAPTCNRAVMG